MDANPLNDPNPSTPHRLPHPPTAHSVATNAPVSSSSSSATPTQPLWSLGRPKKPQAAAATTPSRTHLPPRTRTSQIVADYVAALPSDPSPLSHRPTCNVCYSTDITSITDEETASRRRNPVEAVMNTFRSHRMSIGDFFIKLLEPSRSYIRDSPASCSQLGRFLKGKNTVSPVDIAEAMRAHPWSVPHHADGSIAHPTTTFMDPTAKPPRSSSAFPVRHPTSTSDINNPVISDSESEADLEELHSTLEEPEPISEETRQGVHGAYAYHSLEEWAAHRVRRRVEKEVRSLTTLAILRAVQGALTWTALLSFSIGPLAAAIISTAPVLWSIITTVAVSPHAAREAAQSDDWCEGEEDLGRTPKGKGRNRRDPWLVGLLCIYLL